MALLPPSYDGSLMSMNVSIDVKIPDEFIDNISQEFLAGLPKVLNQIGLLGHTYWTQIASQRLRTARRDYIRALSYSVVGHSVQLTLGGANLGGQKNTFVIAVELGGPKFDMKPGFLNSPKARTGSRKFPKALIAANPDLFKRNKAPRKYMIVPILKDPQVVASAANVKFRTVHSNSPSSSWWHPGWKGVQLTKDVIDELNNRIIPEAFKPLMESIKK